MTPAVLALASMMLAGTGHPAAQVETALHAVEWTDPSGDVQPIGTSGGSVPGFDVVKVGISSDGAAVTIAATLVEPYRGGFASDVVQVYFDIDNDESTGAETFWGKKPGFELKSALAVCVSYEGGGMACSGAIKGSPVSKYEAVATLARLEKGTLNTESIVGSLSGPKTPIEGAIVSARLTYAQLGVQSGQAIRLVVRETDGPYDETADFPTTLLTLQ